MSTTTDELRTVFDKLVQLPEEEQAHFTHLIREELEAEQAWERAFADPRSPGVLARMARKARAEREAGKTQPLNALFDEDEKAEDEKTGGRD